MSSKNESLELEVAKLTDEVKKVKSRVYELQKTVDLLYKDREILEDIQGSIRKLQELQIQARVHHDNMAQDIKADVKESQLAVEEAVDEVKEDVVRGLVGDEKKKLGIF